MVHVNIKDMVKPYTGSKMPLILVTILFAVTTFYIGLNHEHWFDEAQAFLIARDAESITDFFYLERLEGTPCLWALILKLFILLGGTYQLYFLVPWFFSTAGVILLEFKVKTALYVKILLPFTFFIFYQYSVVARSYCLVFPLLMISLICSGNKISKPAGYTLSMILLSWTSAYGTAMGGSLFLIFLWDIISQKKRPSKPVIICCIASFISFVMIVLLVAPTSDNLYITVMVTQYSFFQILASVFVLPNTDKLLSLIVTLLIALLFIFLILNSEDVKKSFISFFVLLMPLSLLFIFLNNKDWHIGIFFLFVVYVCLLLGFFERPLGAIAFIMIFLVHISWSVACSAHDISGEYSSGELVSEYIKDKQKDHAELEVYEITPMGGTTAILPYFEDRLFENRVSTYMNWSRKRQELFRFKKPSSHYVIYVKDDLAEWEYSSEDYSILEKKEFPSFLYFKYGYSERSGFTVYLLERKDTK